MESVVELADAPAHGRWGTSVLEFLHVRMQACLHDSGGDVDLCVTGLPRVCLSQSKLAKLQIRLLGLAAHAAG